MAGEKSDVGVYFFAFGLAVFASTLLVVADGACDTEKVQRCASVFAGDHLSKFTYTRDELEAACRLTDGFVRCLTTSGCASDVQGAAAMNTVKRLFDYMCEQHKEDFLEHAQCFGSKTVQSSVTFCGDKKNLETGDRPRPTPCEVASQGLSCMVRSIDVCCGKKASAVMDDFVRYVMASVSSPLAGNCQLRSDLDVKISHECSGCIKLVQHFGTTLLAIIVLGLIRKDCL